MINVSFPDGSKREYPDGSTPLSIAEAISKSLAKRSVIAKVDGQLYDMKRPLEGDVALELLDEIDPKKELMYEVETRVGFGDLLPGVFGSTDLMGRIGGKALALLRLRVLADA